MAAIRPPFFSFLLARTDRQFAGDHHETGVADHPMVGPDGSAGDVPGAVQGLEHLGDVHCTRAKQGNVPHDEHGA